MRYRMGLGSNGVHLVDAMTRSGIMALVLMMVLNQIVVTVGSVSSHSK